MLKEKFLASLPRLGVAGLALFSIAPAHGQTITPLTLTDTLRYDMPDEEVRKAMVKCFSSSTGAWNKASVSPSSTMASGSLEFTYSPDSLLDVKRMGYMDCFARLKWGGGVCVVTLSHWIQRAAVTFAPDPSFGPIVEGPKCSPSLCNKAVYDCERDCRVELLPFIAQTRKDVLAELSKHLAGKPRK